MHAKGWGAWGTFRVTHDISHLTRAGIFSEVGNECELFMRFSTVAGELGSWELRTLGRQSPLVGTGFWE